jgi:hypothetical protein
MLRNDAERLRELAREIVAERVAVWTRPVAFMPADENWMGHLDRRFHADMRQQFGSLAFRPLGYLAYVRDEDSDDAPIEPGRFVCQILISADNISVAVVSAVHFGARLQFAWHRTNRAGGGRFVDLSTETVDGHWIATTNNSLPTLPELRTVPGKVEAFLEPLSSPKRLFAAHLSRVTPVAERAIRLETIEDVIGMAQRGHQRSERHLRSIGFVDPAATVDALFSDLEPSIKRVLTDLLSEERDVALKFFGPRSSQT